MVRDPSIVSPTLTGVFIGGGHNKHGTGSRCTLQKQCRPPSPRRRWRCDRSSYKRSLFSRSGIGSCTTSLGLRSLSQHPVTVSGLCGIEPLRDGQAHRSELCLSLTHSNSPLDVDRRTSYYGSTLCTALYCKLSTYVRRAASLLVRFATVI